MQYRKIENLGQVLADHDLWRATNGKEGERANLSEANLSCAFLSNANLSSANLSEADLSSANLSEADLSGADLRGADLSGAGLRGAGLREADLRGADLSGADLSGADLSGAGLRGADLIEANLSGANLSGANLIEANLSKANLSGANLSGGDLSKANLSGGDLSGANLIEANLSGVTGFASVTEEAIAELLWVAKTVLADPKSLEMKDVHTCETTHCAAGWICHHNAVAKTLEQIWGWNVAACIVCPIPEFTGLFYSGNERMLDFLREVDADQGDALKAKYEL